MKIKIELLDGNIKEFEKGITCMEIVSSISTSLAKKTIVAKLNGNLTDLSTKIEQDSKLEFIVNDKQNPDLLEIIRHDAAHVLAQALKEIYKDDIQITIGPVIENGFYYDVSIKNPFSTDDLLMIERKMIEISKRNEKIQREIWKRDEAIKFFESIGEKYKAEIISSIPSDQDISLYRQGEFIDLCRGPHAPSTGFVKYFKLLKVSGAYWRGDSKNEMLQRIYGTAWESKESLDQYLYMLEEAEKRDHRNIGRDLELFHIQDEAPGSIFWHPNGWIIYTEIEKYMRNMLKKYKYQEVKTPQMVDKILWEKSGHWEKFRENMFVIENEDKTFAIKPMNCPCHIQIFNKGIRSYKDLPLRMAEFGSCFRNESSGSLHGLMRVRSFVQDDAHIFCTQDQIEPEVSTFCKMLKEVYAKFGFNDFIIKLSTRPELRAGSDETWDKAEKALADAITSAGYEYDINPGEGAFYGPKLEFVLKDAIGRHWQCGTMQVDFVLPDRLDAKFVNSKGEKENVVMLHRAILGSFERFIGMLIENCAGVFPFWLAPIQVAVCTITNDIDEYGKDTLRKLENAGIRAILDTDNQTLNYKISNHSRKKIPYILVLGKKEMEQGVVNVRKFGSNSSENISINEFINNIKYE
jgi:threonyl-tRNA synthetase